MSTLPERVLEWTQSYTESLTENYKQHSVRMHENFTSEWSKDQLESIKNGTANLTKFVIKTGRKYHKIMQHEFDTFRDRNEYREGSVNCFVDKNTGEVYMAASWSSPAKHVRFDMRVIRDRKLMHTPSFVTWNTGYLYMR